MVWRSIIETASRGAGWTIRLHEKGGKQHAMPWAGRGVARLYRRCRHRRGPEGLAVPHRARPQRHHAIRQAYEPARRLADGSAGAPAAAGIAAPIGCHTFRATGITAYLANGGALEHAQEMAAHESPRTTKLYDRTKERLTQDEVERIRL
jgi:integrase